MYRNWGQFAYNGMYDRSTKPIIESELIINETNASQANVEDIRNQIKADQETGNIATKDPTLNSLSSINTIFIPLIPYAGSLKRCWIGGEDKIFVTDSIMSASRLGIDNVKTIDPFLMVPAPSGSDFSFGRGVSKINVATTKSFNAGYDLLSGNKSNSESKQVVDFIDMNGDRYPDILTSANIQYTKPDGTFSVFYSNGIMLHEAKNDYEGLGINGKAGKVSFGMSSQVGKNKTILGPQLNSGISFDIDQIAGANIGASAGYNRSKSDQIKSTWIDVNSDGLPDKVTPKGYQLNLGYNNFSSMYSQGFNDICIGDNATFAPGISAGFSSDKNSFSGGIGLSFGSSRSSSNLQDMNGDGLPDIVEISGEKLKVQLNTGSGFLAKMDFVDISKSGLIDLEKTKFNSSNGSSIGGSATFGFIIPFTPIKVVFNPAFNSGQGIGRTVRQIIDINGDGFVDYLYSDAEGNLEAMLSKI